MEAAVDKDTDSLRELLNKAWPVKEDECKGGHGFNDIMMEADNVARLFLKLKSASEEGGPIEAADGSREHRVRLELATWNKTV